MIVVQAQIQTLTTGGTNSVDNHNWALEYHTLILFLKGTFVKNKSILILFLPGYLKAQINAVQSSGSESKACRLELSLCLSIRVVNYKVSLRCI